jgi:putative chitinase
MVSAVDLITPATLHAACPERSSADLAPIVPPIVAACVKFEMNTIRRVAAFVTQMAHEAQLQPKNESLNYSVAALISLFSRERISSADAGQLGRRPGEPGLSVSRQMAIANLIYGGDWGRRNLGNTQPGDGWIFRGTGPLQNTGRDNATRLAESLGKSLDETVAFMRTEEGGIMAAAWFWDANGINSLADTPGVEDETRKINGGLNGLADRKSRFDAMVAAMLQLEGKSA